MGEKNCVVTSMDSIRLSTIVAFVTDVILLSIMLVGLSRMRRHGDGTMTLGRLLWNQVGQCFFLPTAVPSAHRRIFIREGVIWLVVAVVAELTPTVSQFCLLHRSRQSPFYTQIFICLDLNGIFVSPPSVINIVD